MMIDKEKTRSTKRKKVYYKIELEIPEYLDHKISIHSLVSSAISDLQIGLKVTDFRWLYDNGYAGAK